MARTSGRKDLTPEEEAQIVGFLLGRLLRDGSLQYGSMGKIAREIGCHRHTVRKVWERHCSNSPKPKRGGSEPQYDPDEIKAAIKEVPLHERTNVRAASVAIKIPKSTIHRYIGWDGPLRRTTVHVKPALTAEHKIERLQFCVTFVDRPIGLRRRYFQDMYDVVHVDKKCFYIHKVASTFILAEDEEAPHITCPNKRFITKVMFLAAVARPRYDYRKDRGFSGKIGIFPIVKPRVAKRTTKNQTKGEIINEPVSVDRQVYYETLTTKLLPAIQSSWPEHSRKKTIHIQQDNASPHVSADAAIRDSGLAAQGWKLSIRRQPPRSPDLNVLDLGFFNAIQSLQYQKRAYSVDSLITAVNDAFQEMEAVMEQIMLVGGGNDYDLPRVKSAHFPNGEFPTALQCSEEAYQVAVSSLNAEKET